MSAADGLSPHQLVEFLTAISRCVDSAVGTRTAAELVAEEFDAQVAAVVIADAVVCTVGLGRSPSPADALVALPRGTGTIDIEGIGTCATLTASWKAGDDGRLIVARLDRPFSQDDRNLLLGMASALGLSLDMIGVLERHREEQRVLKVLLQIQRAISHRAPLTTILTAVTDGATSLLNGCPVSLVLDDAMDPEHPIVAGPALSGRDRTVSAPVHIHGVPAGALVAAPDDGRTLRPTDEALLQSFAEHASLALADAQTNEAIQEAYRDPLTGLPNRQLFIDRLTQALADGATSGQRPTVLFVDLDRFKAVNDTSGHAAGDALLRAVADRLRRCTDAGTTVGRFGGDEFAVLLPECDDPAAAASVATGIIETLRRPFVIHGETTYISATIGIASADGGAAGVDADELLSNADVAMYRAKAGGGGCSLVYDASMRVALLDRLDLQASLQGALERRELELHYQPIVDLETGRPTAVEALLRWHHPRRGLVAPSDFIPLAEVTGAIIPIGRWVLDMACHQIALWRRRLPDLTMNVNISVRQLRDREFVPDVRRALDRNALPGEALTLEITESVLIEEQAQTLATLRELKDLRLAVALDDFGTGFSSLSYLDRFPVDALKIDRSFVSGTASRGGDQLVRTVIELGRAYDLDVIAEGVEDDAQRRRLLALGCLRGQGYLFSRPANVASTSALLDVDDQRGVPRQAHDTPPDRLVSER